MGVPIGAGIAFFGGAIATGWAQSRIGAAGAGTVAENRKLLVSSLFWKQFLKLWLYLGSLLLH
jgi:F0F1-type ATP synthase membrane subunit c/vacuolar-type H+-ATPase subunit K